MAQLVKTRRSSSHSPRTRTSPTFEQLLRVEDTYWTPRAPSPRVSPTFGKSDNVLHCHEDNVSSSSNHNKKSVLTKVKERAKKLRHSLSGSGRKRQGIEHMAMGDIITPHSMGDDIVNTPPPTRVTLLNHDDIIPPSTGVNTTLDGDNSDELDKDPEYLGAPMYESEAAPDTYKETARQHPRAIPVVSKNHALAASTTIQRLSDDATTQENEKPVSPNTTLTDKLRPAYNAVSDTTHKIASKIANLTIATPEVQNTPSEVKITNETNKWDKGVSVKEYFMNKLEPVDDEEKALSQAITDAISPTKTSHGDSSVVEKVKDAVSSFFWHDEPNSSMTKAETNVSSVNTSITNQQNRGYYSNSANSSPIIPVSTNAHEVVEEENRGKLLQAN